MLGVDRLVERRPDHDDEPEPALAGRARQQARLLVAGSRRPLDRDPAGAGFGELAPGQDAPLEQRAGRGAHHLSVGVDDLCERLGVGQRGFDRLVAAGGEIAFEVREPRGQAVIQRLTQRGAVLGVDEHAHEQAQHRRNEREHERQPAPQGPGTPDHVSLRSR